MNSVQKALDTSLRDSFNHWKETLHSHKNALKWTQWSIFVNEWSDNVHTYLKTCEKTVTSVIWQGAWLQGQWRSRLLLKEGVQHCRYLIVKQICELGWGQWTLSDESYSSFSRLLHILHVFPNKPSPFLLPIVTPLPHFYGSLFTG